MRAVPYILVMLFALLQALVTFYWMQIGAAQLFSSLLKGFYRVLPAWSALAFSIGWYWLILPLASIAWLFVQWRRQQYSRHAWTVAIASLLVLLSMIYAMYPLHIMATRPFG